MYVQQTLLHLDPSSPEVASDSSDIRRMHTRVMTMFGGDYQRIDGAPRDLWTLSAPNRLIVQHPVAIDSSLLPAGYTTRVSSRRAELLWQAGSRVRWAVVANPTKRSTPRTGQVTDSWINHFDVQRTGRPKVTVTPIRDPAGIREWLGRNMAGATIGDVEIGHRRTAHGRKGEHRVTIVTVRAAGTATVTDPEAWARVLACGIGHGKAYGCGLVVCEAA